jgi:hypothetical protein
MAKKVVATLQKGEGKNFAKVIRAVKSEKQELTRSKKKWYL